MMTSTQGTNRNHEARKKKAQCRKAIKASIQVRLTLIYKVSLGLTAEARNMCDLPTNLPMWYESK